MLDFFETQRTQLLGEFRRFSNLASYDHLISLLRSELASRGPDWTPSLTNLNAESDGLLATPRPGVPPFETVENVRAESRRILRMLPPATARRMLQELLTGVQSLPDAGRWRAAVEDLTQLLLAPRA